MNDGNYTIKYNEHIVNVSIHVASGVPYATNDKELGAELLIDNAHSVDLRPPMPMYQYNQSGCWLWIKDNSYKLSYKATVAQNGGAYANFTYARR